MHFCQCPISPDDSGKVPLAAEKQDAHVATTGVLRGTTVDSATGRPVSANVTIRNVETNFTRTIKSSDQGIFVATLVPLGNYQVSARAVGYTPATKSSIGVNVGQTVEVPLAMEKTVTTLGEMRRQQSGHGVRVRQLPQSIVSFIAV